jgi:hypothetical protein
MTHDYESLDVGVLGEDEKVTLEHSMLLIQEHLRQSLKNHIGWPLPIPDDVLETAKDRFRTLAKEMGAKDVRFELAEDGHTLQVTFIDLPPMKALSYELVFDVPDEPSPTGSSET